MRNSRWVFCSFLFFAPIILTGCMAFIVPPLSLGGPKDIDDVEPIQNNSASAKPSSSCHTPSPAIGELKLAGRVELTRKEVWTQVYCQGKLHHEYWSEQQGARDDFNLPTLHNAHDSGAKISVINLKTCDREILVDNWAKKDPYLWINISNSWASAAGHSSFHVENGMNPIEIVYSRCPSHFGDNCLPAQREVILSGTLNLEVVYTEIRDRDNPRIVELRLALKSTLSALKWAHCHSRWMWPAGSRFHEFPATLRGKVGSLRAIFLSQSDNSVVSSDFFTKPVIFAS